MKQTTTLKVSRWQLEMLRPAAYQEWHKWRELRDLQKWRDAKEKDRILTYEHHSAQLVDLILAALREVSN